MFHATGLPGWMRAAGSGVAPATQASPSVAEKRVLQDQVEMLQSQLDAVKKQLAELQTSDATQ